MELMDTPASRSRLVEIYRRFEPTLVLAHAPEDYHPDHRAASTLAEAASWFCASRGHRGRSLAMQAPPALWWMDTLDMSGFEPGFYIDISEFVGLKMKLLACHQSQLIRGKDADFSSLAEMMRLQFRARGMQSGVEAAEAFRTHNAFKRGRAW
jgi:LmbE family N-acetylglucosaminyl deacetylase